MPVYKTEEAHLRESINSILSQTFTDFDFLILDDCPDDDREHIVKSFDDKRIKYFKNKRNLGISSSRNKLLELADGEYLAIFDHDDISMPDRLEKEASFLDAHPEVGIVSGQLEYFPQTSITCHPEHNLDIKIALMDGCLVAHTAAMIRKSVLEKSGIRYEEDYSPAEDYRLWLRLIDKTMFYNFQEVFVKYRNLEGNTSHIQTDKMTNADALCRCYAIREYPYLFSKLLDLKKQKRRQKSFLYKIKRLFSRV